MATINTTDPKPGFVYNTDTDTWISPGLKPDSVLWECDEETISWKMQGPQ